MTVDITPLRRYLVIAYVSSGLCISCDTNDIVDTDRDRLVPEFILDADGNAYKTVKIGNQVWIAENLKTTKLNDKTPITLVEDGYSWNVYPKPGYCWYDNDTTNKETFGALYNYYTVSNRKFAPKGWHVPTKTDWLTLISYLTESDCNCDSISRESKIAV